MTIVNTFLLRLYYRTRTYILGMETVLIPIIIALVVAFTPKVKYVAQILGTITHELGHAIVVMPFGGKLKGIKLRLNTEGEAVVSLPRYAFPWYHLLRIVNLFAGYGAPLYMSLLLYVSVAHKWDIALNVVFALMSIIVLLFIRNWFGLLIALSFAAVNALFIFLLPDYMDAYAITIGVILLVRGLTDIYDAARWTFKNKLERSDFTLASEELHGSPQLWYILFCIFHVIVLTALTLLGFHTQLL